MPATAYRFGCRWPGEMGYTVYFALTAFNTAEGAARLVAQWNQEDRGRREWMCEESFPTDVDYPGNHEKHLRRLAKARKAKQRAAQKEWAGLVSAGLA